MRRRFGFFSVTLLILSVLMVGGRADTATAGPILDRVKASGVVHCGSTERPGLATAGSEDHWSGLNVDICRAVATAVLGGPDHVEFHEYEMPQQFDALRNGTDDLAFLSASEIADQHLAGKLLPGPAVYIESHAVMVPVSSPARHVEDLAGKTVCFMNASGPHRSLENYFQVRNLDWLRIGYSEDGEMIDAYNVGRCEGVAYELTTLVTVPSDRGVNNLSSRILPDSLAVFPILATTPASDPQWTAVVAWTVQTLINAERPETHWYAGGAQAFPIDGTELGLDKAWQARVIAAVGHYGQIFERNLGQQSSLKLPRGFNANQINGGLLLGAFLE